MPVLDGAEVVLVYHGQDELGWQFLGGKRPTAAEVVLTTHGDLLAVDPTLAEIVDLPAGWIARRARRGAPWRRCERSLVARFMGRLRRAIDALFGRAPQQHAPAAPAHRHTGTERARVVIRTRSIAAPTAQRA